MTDREKIIEVARKCGLNTEPDVLDFCEAFYRAVQAEATTCIQQLEAELVALRGEQKMRRMAEESNAKLLAENEALRRPLADAKTTIAHESDCCEAYKAESASLREQLAESQALVTRLREALGAFAYRFPESSVAREALALPTDNTALREMIAKAGEVMRERCVAAICEDKGPLCGTKYATDAIRALPGVTMEDIQ